MICTARQQLADVLDAAEAGERIVIERRGARFIVQQETKTEEPAPRRAARVEILDPAVEAGSWSWSWSTRALRFRAR